MTRPIFPFALLTVPFQGFIINLYCSVERIRSYTLLTEHKGEFL